MFPGTEGEEHGLTWKLLREPYMRNGVCDGRRKEGRKNEGRGWGKGRRRGGWGRGKGYQPSCGSLPSPGPHTPLEVSGSLLRCLTAPVSP